MLINISEDLPAIEQLKQCNITVNVDKGFNKRIRILILNLMPNKVDAEKDLLKRLGNYHLPLEITFITTESYNTKNTSLNHMKKFYKTFPEVKKNSYDGFIVTGAPVEHGPIAFRIFIFSKFYIYS